MIYCLIYPKLYVIWCVRVVHMVSGHDSQSAVHPTQVWVDPLQILHFQKKVPHLPKCKVPSKLIRTTKGMSTTYST